MYKCSIGAARVVQLELLHIYEYDYALFFCDNKWGLLVCSSIRGVSLIAPPVPSDSDNEVYDYIDHPIDVNSTQRMDNSNP